MQRAYPEENFMLIFMERGEILARGVKGWTQNHLEYLRRIIP